jgi:hypothetical protein
MLESLKSWKTALLGVATIIGALGTAAVAQLDADPDTVVNTEVLLAAITAGVGLIFARDADKTDKK